LFLSSLERQREETRRNGERDRTEAEGGWQGVSESAVSAKRGLGLVWRETGAVRNGRPSRGQAASARKKPKWEKGGVA